MEQPKVNMSREQVALLIANALSVSFVSLYFRNLFVHSQIWLICVNVHKGNNTLIPYCWFTVQKHPYSGIKNTLTGNGNLGVQQPFRSPLSQTFTNKANRSTSELFKHSFAVKGKHYILCLLIFRHFLSHLADEYYSLPNSWV